MFLFIRSGGAAGLLCLLPAVFSPSCSSTKDAGTPRSPAAIIARVEQRNAQLRSLEARGSVSMDTPDQAGSGSMELRLCKPDSLLVEIFGPFGVRVAKGFVTADSFTFYNNLDNTVAAGATDAAALRSMLHVPFDFPSLLDILSGTMGFGRLADSAAINGAENGGVYTIARHAAGGERIEYDVDLSYDAVTRRTRKDATGRILDEVTFRDFRKKQGMYLPTMISISRPNDDENVTLVYDQLSVNEFPLDFSFSYPKSAVRIRL